MILSERVLQESPETTAHPEYSQPKLTWTMCIITPNVEPDLGEQKTPWTASSSDRENVLTDGITLWLGCICPSNRLTYYVWMDKRAYVVICKYNYS